MIGLLHFSQFSNWDLCNSVKLVQETRHQNWTSPQMSILKDIYWRGVAGTGRRRSSSTQDSKRYEHISGSSCYPLCCYYSCSAQEYQKGICSYYQLFHQFNTDILAKCWRENACLIFYKYIPQPFFFRLIILNSFLSLNFSSLDLSVYTSIQLLSMYSLFQHMYNNIVIQKNRHIIIKKDGKLGLCVNPFNKQFMLTSTE